MVDLALLNGTELFTGSDRRAYARFKTQAGWETWEIEEGETFCDWMTNKFYQRRGRMPQESQVKRALRELRGRARFGGLRGDVNVRMGEHDGKLYLDLADEKWRVVEIDRDGWRVVEKSPVAFRRPRGLLPLPIPTPPKEDTWDKLRGLLNPAMDDHDWTLIVSWLVGSTNYDRPFPVLCLNGEQGAGKSFTSRVLRSIIDPNVAPLRSPFRSEKELSITASNSLVVALDNLSGLTKDQSNSLCRLATGAGFGSRELYKNEQEFILKAKRPVLINGIENFATAPDLLQRCLLVTLPKIPKYRPERDLLDELKRIHPEVLGAVLNAAVVSLRGAKGYTESGLRMVDFALWVAAAAEAGVLPFSQREFLDVYETNQREGRMLALEDATLVPVIEKMLTPYQPSWTGTATELLSVLSPSWDQTKKKDYPQSPRQLTNALRRLVQPLHDRGIMVHFWKNDGRRLVKLERTS